MNANYDQLLFYNILFHGLFKITSGEFTAFTPTDTSTKSKSIDPVLLKRSELMFNNIQLRKELGSILGITVGEKTLKTL